jgi:formate dehydrogenase major subunit
MRTRTAHDPPDRKVDSVCPYCGVGCQITYNIKAEKIVSVDGRDGPANHARLCVKGRFGLDYVHHPQRLTKPLVRKPGVPKRADDQIDLRLDPLRAAGTRRSDLPPVAVRDPTAAGAGGFGRGKRTSYLFETGAHGFGTKCRSLPVCRLVGRPARRIGSGAVTAPSLPRGECIIVITPIDRQSPVASFIKMAKRAELIVMDPRFSGLTRHAWKHLRFKPGTYVPMLNAMIHTIIEEGLIDQQYVDGVTEGFAALKQAVKDFTPEKMAPLCGVDAGTLRLVARTYAKSRASIIFWGMGISQHCGPTMPVA